MADQRLIPWARRPYQTSGTAPNAPTGHTGNAFVPASDTQQHSQYDAFHPLPPGPSRRDSGRYPQNLLRHPGSFDQYPQNFNQNPQNFNQRSNVMAPRLVPFAENPIFEHPSTLPSNPTLSGPGQRYAFHIHSGYVPLQPQSGHTHDEAFTPPSFGRPHHPPLVPGFHPMPNPTSTRLQTPAMTHGLCSLSDASDRPHPTLEDAELSPTSALNPPPPAAEYIKPGPISRRARNGVNNYGALIVDRPEAHVQPPLGVDIGIIEICTFFPAWFQIPDVAMRAVINGWSRENIAKAQLDAVGPLTQANQKKCVDRVQKQISKGGKLWCNLPDNADWRGARDLQDQPNYNDLRANTWELRYQYELSKRSKTFGHMKLSDVHSKVPRANWPQGADRLVLTRCFEYDVAHPDLNLDTSHWDWIIQQLQVASTNLDHRHDVQALQRLKANVPDPRR